MSINCSHELLELFNAHRKVLSKTNGNKKTLTHEDTMKYLLENNPMAKRAEQFVKNENDFYDILPSEGEQ